MSDKARSASDEPTPEEVLRALRQRLIASPQLRDQPAGDISHDLMINGYLEKEPDPAAVGEALKTLLEEGLPEVEVETQPAGVPSETEGTELRGLKGTRERAGLSIEQLATISALPLDELQALEARKLKAQPITVTRLAGHLKSTREELTRGAARAVRRGS